MFPISPSTMHVVVQVAVLPAIDGSHDTLYPVMVEPPLLVGALKNTRAFPPVFVTVVIDGAPGTVVVATADVDVVHEELVDPPGQVDVGVNNGVPYVTEDVAAFTNLGITWNPYRSLRLKLLLVHWVTVVLNVDSVPHPPLRDM
jgi:hypothetical protein